MPDPMAWIEISLEVDAELAEPVAEVLARYLDDGVVIEQQAGLSEAGPVPNDGEQVRVYGYIAVDSRAAATRRKIEEGLWYLDKITPLPEPEYRRVVEEDWSGIWKDRFQPTPVGEKLLVLPSWHEVGSVEGKIPVRIDPGMVFGTGTHPTTSLTLALLEPLVRIGRPMIDVGCGTAILAIAALKLGAGHALGIDIDPKAVGEAQKNARLNQVEEYLETGTGSVDEIVQGRFSIRSAPLVAANIIAPRLIELFAEGLADLVESGGQLVLSGMLLEQEGQVIEVSGQHGLEVEKRLQEGDWVALQLKK
ncbi:MAG: 50S ribosomal protein L11 methyltransferase [Anaerolineales bacterium]|nr:50S ribosomal protein L11 methyltransferase [Anaerolineales bacterium]